MNEALIQRLQEWMGKVTETICHQPLVPNVQKLEVLNALVAFELEARYQKKMKKLKTKTT